MLHLHESQNPHPLPPPSGLVKRPICALSGLKPSSACSSIVEEYFYPTDLATYEQQLDTFYQAVTTPPVDPPPVDPPPTAPSERTKPETIRHGTIRHGTIRSDQNTGSDRPQYQLDLPDDYDGWLAQQSGHAVPLTQLKIISPQNDDVFLLPADLVQSADGSNLGQRLEFKIAGSGQEPTEWWLNGDRLAIPNDQNSNPTSYFWPLQPGQWTLEVKSGDGSDRVQFIVRINEHHQPAQGFSLSLDR